MGGTHLMDVKFVKPFFYKGRLFAWLANTGHWPDTGGMVPGGFCEEGGRIVLAGKPEELASNGISRTAKYLATALI